MVHRKQYQPDDIKNGKCPECGSSRFIYSGSTVKCSDCGVKIGDRFNKYGAKRTEFNGKIYDSKFEASTAQQLELRKRAGDIKDYDTQYRVDIWIYREDGTQAFLVRHKVDFRVHERDGSYTLLEAKGVETADYKFRRKCLEEIWLPTHLDYQYQVVKQSYS